MKKILILILLSSLVLGCRTKQKTSFYRKEGRTEIERLKVDSVKEINLKESTKKVTDNSVKNKKEEFSGDIIIKGKSDTLNPLIFHNVVSGDTLQSIMIRGKADYYIANHYKKSSEDKKETSSKEELNVIQKTARDLVSKENIKDVASKVEQGAKKIKTSGFQAGFWIVLAVLGIVAIVGFGIYKYLKRKQ
ncbi:hypothetical protein BN1195_03592 [Chryseobacterium oranimense G311]|uniref:hypothetical protein n=1 Tax=Chryseobacterium oranimense TaxID=421058 RepID=UPI000533B223|nr:hypothetical protein [Chryseobacterium oranimense]CEJ71247.1 hypothetical protein BN1195_03592 [Chryseobacterium oranimense G311]